MSKKGNLVDKVLGKGRFGGREEYYFYDEDDKLQKIEVKQYDRIGQEAANLFYTIKYGPDGSIDTITKSTSMYEEIVYTEKKSVNSILLRYKCLMRPQHSSVGYYHEKCFHVARRRWTCG